MRSVLDYMLGSVPLVLSMPPTCSRCGDLKTRVPDANRECGSRWRCVPCHREMQRAWDRARTTERRRKYRRKVYGISNEEYEVLLAAQDGGCACCKTPINDVINQDWDRTQAGHVDHNHETGGIRGILCFHCNIGIGHLGDSAEGVQRALDYLTLVSNSPLDVPKVPKGPKKLGKKVRTKLGFLGIGP